MIHVYLDILEVLLDYVELLLLLLMPTIVFLILILMLLLFVVIIVVVELFPISWVISNLLGYFQFLVFQI